MKMLKSKKRIFQKLSFIEILFVLPSLVLIIIFVVIPLLQSIFISFYENNNFVGIKHYTNLFSDTHFFNAKGFFSKQTVGALGNNIIWVLIHMPFSIILGLFFALVFNAQVFGRGILRTLIFLGVTVPMVIGGILARFLFAQGSGLIPTFLKFIGFKSLYVNWLGKPGLALYALIIVTIWLWTGYCMIMYMSALSTIPKEVIEASKIDGASNIKVLYFVILPHLKPVSYVIVAMSLIWELKLFDIVYASTGGGPGGSTNLLSLEMYRTTFKYLEQGKGAAIAVIILLLCSIPMIFLVRNQINDNQ